MYTYLHLNTNFMQYWNSFQNYACNVFFKLHNMKCSLSKNMFKSANYETGALLTEQLNRVQTASFYTSIDILCLIYSNQSL